MASPFSVLMALVGLSCISICSLGCDLSQTHGLGNRRALRLLAQMGKISPFSCLKHRNDFRFPQEEFDGNHIQKVQAISVISEMVQQIFNLFITKDSFKAWDQTLLDKFLNQLYQQLDELDVCLNQEVEREETSQINVDVIFAVRKYFVRIILYLKKKKYSPCSWEIVRLEIMKAFSITTSLENKLVTNHTWYNIENILID